MRGRLSRPNRMPLKAVPWQKKDGGLRLAQDQAILTVRYPQLAFGADPVTKRVYIQGSLVYKLACDIPTPIVVRIEFPIDYPCHEPWAYDESDRFRHEADRHFHPDGQCCLWLRPESEWDASKIDALAHFLDQVVLFFHRQLVCEALPAYEASQWPGGARDHGIAGYLEYVRDKFGGDESLMTTLLPVLVGKKRIGRNEKCPCGKDIKYKRCHLSHVEKVRRSLFPAELNRLHEFSVRASPPPKQTKAHFYQIIRKHSNDRTI